ncbi:MAG TPA: hypothetical protein PLD84_13685, partial [Chitinophagales bacterium]|nr:hypothetical protein [Chitinophagales bacterium]
SKSYKPDWPKNRRSSIARAEFELTKDPVIMAADCGSCDAAPTFVPCTVFCEAAIGLKSNFPEPAPVGWYMKDGENKLQYSNGTIYTATEKTCDGYIDAFDQYGAYSYGGPWRWNNITEEWEAIMYLTGDLFDDPTSGVNTVSFKVLTGCIGKIQVSTNGGVDWTDATGYKSAAQLLSGVQYTRPLVGYRYRLEMKCAICIYYSAEISTYE